MKRNTSIYTTLCTYCGFIIILLPAMLPASEQKMVRAKVEKTYLDCRTGANYGSTSFVKIERGDVNPLLPNMLHTSVMDARWKSLLLRGTGSDAKKHDAMMRALEDVKRLYHKQEYGFSKFILKARSVLEPFIHSFASSKLPLLSDKFSVSEKSTLGDSQHICIMSDGVCPCCKSFYHVSFVIGGELDSDWRSKSMPVKNPFAKAFVSSIEYNVACRDKFGLLNDSEPYVDSSIAALTHEMGHLVGKHQCSAIEVCDPMIWLQHSRNQEAEADLIALLTLRQENYIIGLILGLASHIATDEDFIKLLWRPERPSKYNENIIVVMSEYEPGITLRMLVNWRDNAVLRSPHPPIRTRIEHALTFWAAQLIHSQGYKLAASLEQVVRTATRALGLCKTYRVPSSFLTSIPEQWRQDQLEKLKSLSR